MKKNTLLIAAISIGALLASCSQGTDKKMEGNTETNPTTEVAETGTSEWMIDPNASNIRWEGGTSGAQVYSHFGNIKIKDGNITTNGKNIVAGNVVVDMTSIDPKDEGYSEEHPASDLVGHLSTEDFFASQTYPVSRFEITGVKDGVVTGNLTIRDKTHQESLKLENVSMENGKMKASGTLVFDRQKYDVAWKHYMKDVLLADDIELQISVVANAAPGGQDA